VNRTTEFDFPFYIDHISGTDSGGSGDPDGVAESIGFEVDDREAVYLAYALARRVDQQCVALDGIDRLRLNAAPAAAPLTQRFDDVFEFLFVRVAASGPKVGLHQQVVERTHVHG
jgi:hypothetical protein